ncbi:MAG TPA: DUF1573 domain-containing protein, partial [Bacteroidetes bacterium]|nr:DUF1573 domain-containing protein [Bacteroidota bacterium]
FASFTSNSTRYQPFRLPRRAEPVNLLAAQWLDLNPAQGGDIYYYADADEEIFVVSWIDIPRYNAGDETRQTFQLVLNGEGVIKYQYADDNAPGSNNCIGIQNENGRDGLSIYWGNQDAGPDGRACEIMRSWVRVDPVDGRVSPGNREELTLTLDAAYLIEGDYEADVHVLSNDPDDPDVVIDVAMFVDGEPDIRLVWDDDFGYPDIVDWNDNGIFPDIFADQPYDIEITVRNIGTAVLNIDDISTDNAYFTVDRDTMVIDPRHKAFLTVTFEAEEDGDYDATLTLHSDDPDESDIEIDLHAETFDPPIADFEPLRISKKLAKGTSTEELLTIRNHGDESPLRYDTEVEIVSEPGRDGGERISRRTGLGLPDDSPGPLRYNNRERTFEVPDDALQAAVKNGTATERQLSAWEAYLTELERYDVMPRRDIRGGFDEYGYVWRDEQEGLVDYEWIDITGIGTRLRNVTDDWNSGALDMGWTFNFYGQDFNSLRVCSNGFISFTSDSRSYQPFPLPNDAEPFNMIAAQWVDLDPSDNGDIYFFTDADQELTVISWVDVELYRGDANTRQTFQIILSGDDQIKLQYADDNPAGTNSSIGIQNDDGSDGLRIHWGAADGGPSGKAYGITRSWVRIDPRVGQVDREDLLE